MAITKIHPIKATLNLAIDYITGSEKTDEEVLISSKHCHPSTAHLIFRDTKEKSGTHKKNGTIVEYNSVYIFNQQILT